MASYTQNCNLILPDETENYNIRVANVNNNTIDEELGKKVDKKPNRDLSTNDFTNQYKLLMDEIIRYDEIQVHDDIKIDIVGLKANKADRTELEGVKDRIAQIERKVPLEIITGQEISTSEKIDNKVIYRKRIGVASLLNATTQEIELGLENIEVIKMEGIAKDTTNQTIIPLPYSSKILTSNIEIRIVGNKLKIITGEDQSNLSGFVDIYYTKN